MSGKKFLERRFGLHSCEKELLERRFGSLRHKNTPDSYDTYITTLIRLKKV
jgi:hypothetical protein